MKENKKREQNLRASLPLEARLRVKHKLEQVLSEALSDQYDCNITIKFKPEPDEPVEGNTSSERE